MTTANVNVTKVLLKRGNTVQNNNYTGVSGELTIDTQLKTLRVHDGVTAGGNAITATGAIGSYSNTNTAAYLASQSITSANIGAFQTFANSNAATQTTSINTVNANIGAYQTFANSNAATQTTSIDSINANIGAYQTYANSNAATQTTGISAVNANVTAANSAIQSLSANIGTLVAGAPGALDTLLELGNALGNSSSFSSTVVNWLGNITSNVTAANSRITILDANLGTATTNITTLFTNAATQAGSISTLQTQVYANANVATYLSAFDGNILPAANVTYSLGSETRQWRDLWVSNNTIYIGNTPVRVDGGTLLVNGAPVGGSYNNANVAAYLPSYTGNIAGNIVKNGNVWTFGTNGTTTFPTNISVDYSGGNVQFPRIIADSGKAFSVQAQGNTGSAALSWTVNPDSAGQYAAVAVTKGGGDNLAKVVLTAQSDSGDAATAKTWQFNETGTTRFPGDTILAPAGTSITMQSDQYSQLMWENANVTVAPNMAINSNFYVAQNNATLDIVYRDGSSNQQQKSWLWGVDGSLTFPTGGNLVFDSSAVSVIDGVTDISAIGTVSANVVQVLSDLTSFGASPAPRIYGFSSIATTGSAVNEGNISASGNLVASQNAYVTGNVFAARYNFANGVNILSTVGAGSYGNANVATYLSNYDGDINFTSSTAIISNVDVITVGAHIQSPAYQFSNGTSIFDGITGGGSTYSNANVVAMLAANTTVFIGNTNNVNTYSLQANNTQVFIGGNAAIASGNAATTNSTSLLHNMYFAANGTRLVRNTGAGVGLLSFDPTGFTVSGLVTVQTANSAPALPHWIKANVNGLFAPSGFTTSTITASGTVAVNATTGIQTSQTTFPLVNQTATTILFGGAATTINMGSGTIGGSGSNVFVGNAIGTSSGNLTVRAFGTYNSVNSLTSSGGYGNTTYSNIAVTGGSGTGMIISMSGAASGYLASATVTNPGTGYQNGETITIPAGNPGGSLGGSFVIGNYNAAYLGQVLADYSFGIDGNLTLPGNVTIASVGSIRYANGVNYASTVTGTYSNVNVEAYIGGNIGAYYAFANANAATQATSINTVNANIGAYQTYANTTFTYSNTNVAAYLTTATITTTGNITAGNLTTSGNISATGSILATPAWTSAGAITLTATTTNPTKGTTTSDNISYRQLGAKQWEIILTYIQTVANGVNGSGDYLVTLPNSLSFDTTLPSQQITTTNIGTNTYALMSYIIPSGSGLINNDTLGGQVYPIVYDATKFRILTTTYGSAIQCWGSGYYSLGGDDPKIQLTFRFTST